MCVLLLCDVLCVVCLHTSQHSDLALMGVREERREEKEV